MGTFVLIHGAGHGGWCWYKVAALLEEQGHTAVAPDLPGHGRDKTPIALVTLERYVESVCKIVDAQREPVILVGHSMGGRVITRVGEERPDRIKWLVYVAAFLPQKNRAVSIGTERNAVAAALANMEISADGTCATFREATLREMLYADCTDEDFALARLLLVPQPIAPYASPVETSEANWGRIPRIYIECLRDRAVPPAVQKSLYTATPCQRVISMDTGHSPFFAAPEELAKHLAAL